jgi:hypothetical protein
MSIFFEEASSRFNYQNMKKLWNFKKASKGSSPYYAIFIQTLFARLNLVKQSLSVAFLSCKKGHEKFYAQILK